MFKKMLLILLCITSAVATAQIRLDLDATITHSTSERHVSETIVVDENVPTTFEYDDLKIIICAKKVDDTTIIIEAEVLEKTATNELICISKPVLRVTENKIATLTVGDSDNNALTLLITFEFTE